ncbi:MAG: alpha-1,4-glucan--maltose-1-phosphate maltosyltransferase [Acidocella sp.]|nr:alpha-1,4-glucan--maltose-1-phosphate maltosyltransferase [Acidocella sp.]
MKFSSSRKMSVTGGNAARISIDGITPQVDCGQYPARFIVGETVNVQADLLADGHDLLAAEILFRPETSKNFERATLGPIGNDRWGGEFPLTVIGRYVFVIHAWKDFFGSFVDELSKKHDAGIPTELEMLEGIALVKQAMAAQRGALKSSLTILLESLDAADPDTRRTMLLDENTRLLMQQADLKKFAATSHPVIVDAEPQNACFASWYEIFPRSQSADPTHHGTFDDVIGQLPRISEMGFDVLYFPPIHPIGRLNRKGRNNTLTPAPNDPGSPYAIGASEGGHDAIHPQLGTIEDFRRLRDAAANLGIALALDFAIQCAPDHPWLTAHPEWFDWRPDGSLRYAENPPKKYQDIVNVDFYAPGAQPSLWLALRDIVQYWVDQGIRLFRVDNPHTKPFPFWEWMIADIRGRHPDVLFLAEAFTRPKIMCHLAKVGFSQSYTYFTWRNTKEEIETYLTELTTSPMRDYFRPHFFVNTPDINPRFLQTSGRNGHLIRAVLGATLSGLWGVYNGFELCEATALPGREEYDDSEKYTLKSWDYNRAGNIVAEISKLNRIRRENRALQSHLNIEFLTTNNKNILYFRKFSSNGNTLLIAVNLDPFNAEAAQIEIPLWRFGIDDHGAIAVEDLMSDIAFTWYGKFQTILIDPNLRTFFIWRISNPKALDS